jgi:hypothetical protein
MPTQVSKLLALKAKDKVTNANLPESGFGLTKCQPYFLYAEHLRQLGGARSYYPGIVYQFITLQHSSRHSGRTPNEERGTQSFVRASEKLAS